VAQPDPPTFSREGSGSLRSQVSRRWHNWAPRCRFFKLPLPPRPWPPWPRPRSAADRPICGGLWAIGTLECRASSAASDPAAAGASGCLGVSHPPKHGWLCKFPEESGPASPSPHACGMVRLGIQRSAKTIPTNQEPVSLTRQGHRLGWHAQYRPDYRSTSTTPVWDNQLVIDGMLPETWRERAGDPEKANERGWQSACRRHQRQLIPALSHTA